MDDMISNKHPCLGMALKQFAKDNHYPNKDRNLGILEELCVIEPHTYTRLKNYEYTIRLRTTISICIVLCLDVNTSEALLNAAGYTLMKKSRVHQAYSFVIQKNHNDSVQKDKDELYCYERISEINMILKQLGIDEKHHLGIR